MEPDFRALQVIAEVSLGLVGFSAIIIALSRSREGFSDPDNFRVQLLNFAAFGAMFNALIPFAIFGSNSLEISWTIVGSVLCFYSAVGLLTFPRKVFLFTQTRIRRNFSIASNSHSNGSFCCKLYVVSSNSFRFSRF